MLPATRSNGASPGLEVLSPTAHNSAWHARDSDIGLSCLVPAATPELGKGSLTHWIDHRGLSQALNTPARLDLQVGPRLAGAQAAWYA